MSKPIRFEEGAALAWTVDLDRGYRKAAGVEWRFADLAGSPGAQGWNAASIVGADLAGIAPSLEPVEDGRIRFRASLPLVVWLHGDDRPSRGRSVEEVPYGSVVRAGPLLLAPLYAEQLESVRKGRMTLPVVPPIAGLPEEERDDSDLEAAARARNIVSRRWTISWAGAFAAAPFVALCAGRMEGCDWWGSRCFAVTFVALVVAHWLGVLFVGLPVQVAMMRWRRTPGASAELSPRSAEAGRAASCLAIATVSATLLGLPWLLGLATLTVLFSVNSRVFDLNLFDWIAGSALLGMPMSILYCIFAFWASSGLHSVVVRWLAAAPRRASAGAA